MCCPRRHCRIVLRGRSFTVGTKVLAASGEAVAISRLRRGDKVIATDVRTGTVEPAVVSAVWLNHDTNLFNLTVRVGRKASIIHTTWNHPFWDLTQHKWVKAGELSYGDHLRTRSGGFVMVAGGWTPRRHDGWMWDLTVPGPTTSTYGPLLPQYLYIMKDASTFRRRLERTRSPSSGLLT